MTAIDLRASTMQILERFDKTDTSLWQKVLDAINSIYKNEEEAAPVRADLPDADACEPGPDRKSAVNTKVIPCQARYDVVS